MHFVYFVVFVMLPYPQVLLDVFRVLATMASELPEKRPYQCKKISHDWMIEDTVSTNCGCPNRTLEFP
jgi:hypothetical protein